MADDALSEASQPLGALLAAHPPRLSMMYGLFISIYAANPFLNCSLLPAWG